MRGKGRRVGILFLVVLIVTLVGIGVQFVNSYRKKQTVFNGSDTASSIGLSEDETAETEEIGISGNGKDSASSVFSGNSYEQMTDLEAVLNDLIESDTGTWSIYVKNLSSGESLSINHQSMYAASLIKLFVLEETYANYDAVAENIEANNSSAVGGSEILNELLELMIEQSDNESYNEIVRQHSSSNSFSEGCLVINDWLESSDYPNTGIFHTLSPSNTESESISATEKNHTSVEDCGRLLEAIYNGTCVSGSASEEMLEMLLNQNTTYKIPAGVPDGIVVANKTGETDDYEHDVAIVYGEETDYILCIMSECSAISAISMIQKISKIVYAYLNGDEDWSTAADGKATEENTDNDNVEDSIAGETKISVSDGSVIDEDFTDSMGVDIWKDSDGMGTYGSENISDGDVYDIEEETSFAEPPNG